MSTKRNLLLSAALLLLPVTPGVASSEEVDMDRAAELYELCVQCHGEDGGGSPLALAPAIAGLSRWYVELQLGNFQHGFRGMSPKDVGGLRMYPMSLAVKKEEDVQALAAYVASLPPVYPEPEVHGGDASRGKQLYVTCQACHGAQAEGMEAVGGPNLRVSSDWYLLKQLQNYKQGIRGTNPGDAAGMRMRPMSMTLADDQAMKDVVAYIMTLAK